MDVIVIFKMHAVHAHCIKRVRVKRKSHARFVFCAPENIITSMSPPGLPTESGLLMYLVSGPHGKRKQRQHTRHSTK